MTRARKAGHAHIRCLIRVSSCRTSWPSIRSSSFMSTLRTVLLGSWFCLQAQIVNKSSLKKCTLKSHLAKLAALTISNNPSKCQKTTKLQVDQATTIPSKSEGHPKFQYLWDKPSTWLQCQSLQFWKTTPDSCTRPWKYAHIATIQSNKCSSIRLRSRWNWNRRPKQANTNLKSQPLNRWTTLATIWLLSSKVGWTKTLITRVSRKFWKILVEAINHCENRWCLGRGVLINNKYRKLQIQQQT